MRSRTRSIAMEATVHDHGARSHTVTTTIAVSIGTPTPHVVMCLRKEAVSTQ